MGKFIHTYGAVDFICSALSIICSCFLAIYYSIISFNFPLTILWGIVLILLIVICIRNVRRTIKTLKDETEE